MPKRKSNNTASAAAKSNDGNKGIINEGSGGDDDDADEAVVLWKKLQETQRKKMKHLEAETEQLQHEKETMLQSVMVASSSSSGDDTTIRDDDIIEIDAGGKILRALRSTLILPSNTMWSYMFSGRWDGSLKRDRDGRIFLDYDHDLIEIIIGYLREKKIEDPANPLTYPYVPPHREESFQRLLQYFGLVDYFIPPSSSTTMIFSTANLVQYKGMDLVTVTENDNNTVNLFYKQTTGGHYGVACSTELDPAGKGCFWKVTIDSLSSSHGFFLGIVGNLNLNFYVPKDDTSFGWMGCHGKPRVFRKGKSEIGKDGWTSFSEGECLYFHFKSNKLSMHSVRKRQKFVIDDGIDTNATKYYFHTNILFNETAMTIGPLNDEERKTFTDNK